jgi:hypothetical protein
MILGLSVGQAMAQPPAVPGREKEPDAGQLRQMYEDVAVFRTLLNRTVARSYGLTGQKTSSNPYGSHSLWIDSRTRTLSSIGAQYPRDAVHAHAHSFGLAEGVYLPGQGVVFSMSAPTPLHDPLAAGTDKTAKGMSPWEQVRRELRGDKVVTAKEQAPRQASLSEALLRLLSENGQHFKGLADNERITVALTFRGASCASCHTAISGMKQQGPRALTGPAVPVVPGSGTPGGGQGTATRGMSKEVQDQASVGDLHLRQGRYREAAQAYESALQVLLRQRELKPDKTDVQQLLLAVELANRLTRVAEVSGDPANVQRWRELSLKFARTALEWSEAHKGKPAEKGTIPLPARLIVSAPKKLLEQAGTGKLSFAEFRKAASVQYLRFPKPEK